jgi:hypothetical protein
MEGLGDAPDGSDATLVLAAHAMPACACDSVDAGYHRYDANGCLPPDPRSCSTCRPRPRSPCPRRRGSGTSRSPRGRCRPRTSLAMSRAPGTCRPCQRRLHERNTHTHEKSTNMPTLVRPKYNLCLLKFVSYLAQTKRSQIRCCRHPRIGRASQILQLIIRLAAEPTLRDASYVPGMGQVEYEGPNRPPSTHVDVVAHLTVGYTGLLCLLQVKTTNIPAAAGMVGTREAIACVTGAVGNLHEGNSIRFPLYGRH